jgi:hypothetical protein
MPLLGSVSDLRNLLESVCLSESAERMRSVVLNPTKRGAWSYAGRGRRPNSRHGR